MYYYSTSLIVEWNSSPHPPHWCIHPLTLPDLIDQFCSLAILPMRLCAHCPSLRCYYYRLRFPGFRVIPAADSLFRATGAVGTRRPCIPVTKCLEVWRSRFNLQVVGPIQFRNFAQQYEIASKVLLRLCANITKSAFGWNPVTKGLSGFHFSSHRFIKSPLNANWFNCDHRAGATTMVKWSVLDEFRVRSHHNIKWCQLSQIIRLAFYIEYRFYS